MSDTVVVLGCNSFAGSTCIAHLLENGFNVVGINRSPEDSYLLLPHKWSSFNSKFQFFQMDINKNKNDIQDVIKTSKPSYILDFAGQGMVAESWDNPAQWYATNILAKAELHQFLIGLRSLKKYIRISTPEVYGSTDKLIPESDTNYKPSTPYALSHACTDLSLKLLNERFSFPVIVGRFANFYGPGQKLYRIVPRTILYALTGKKLMLHGGGKSIRAFLYGDDAASGILELIKGGKCGEIYHFSPKAFYSIKEIVQIVCDILDVNMRDFVIDSEERPGKDHAYLMDSNKSRTELSWRDKIEINKGVKNTFLWIKDNIDDIKKLPSTYEHKP